MNRKMHIVGWMAALILWGVLADNGYAEETPGKVSALFFGDYYWVAKSHEATHEGQNGLWLRRMELTYDRDIAEGFSGRFRLEMNQNDFTAPSTTATPFVKDAYLKWKIGGQHEASFGMTSPPTFALVEEHWGYRSVERTPLDLFGIGSSRDTSIAIKGTLSEKRVGYHFMVGNGSGTKGETDEQKKLYLAIHAGKVSGLIFQLYGDYEDRSSSNKSTRTLQAFVGGAFAGGKGGLLLTRNTQQQGVGKVDQEINVASLYGVVKLAEDSSVYVRVDHLADPNPKADKISYIPMVKTAQDTTVYIVGLDYKVRDNISFLPNVEVVSYGNDANKPAIGYGSDVIPRLTVFYKF